MITPSFALTATERVLPRLALDFTTASLDSRVTFTRTGNTATVVNSSGNIAVVNADIPRFDYDSITLACKGLLIEESRANLLLQSQAIDQAAWTKSNLNTTGTPPYIDVAISPDGTQNADLVIPDTTLTASHKIGQASATVTAGATVTSSIYLKPGGYNFVLLRVSNSSESAAFQVLVNLSNGTVGTPSAYGSGATVAGATITLCKNGWYRVTLTGAITGLLAYAQNIYVYQSGTSSFAGDGTSGVYMWGVQVEAGAFSTSYIPTTTTTVTRNTELAVMTGTNFTSWFNESEGTLVVSASTNSSAILLSFQIATDDNNRVGIGYSGTANIFRIRNNGVGPDPANITASATGYLAALAYKVANSGASSNASAVATSSPGTMTARTTASFGSNLSGNFPQNGTIRRAAYYPLRLTNAELQAFSKI